MKKAKNSLYAEFNERINFLFHKFGWKVILLLFLTNMFSMSISQNIFRYDFPYRQIVANLYGFLLVIIFTYKSVELFGKNEDDKEVKTSDDLKV